MSTLATLRRASGLLSARFWWWPVLVISAAIQAAAAVFFAMVPLWLALSHRPFLSGSAAVTAAGIWSLAAVLALTCLVIVWRRMSNRATLAYCSGAFLPTTCHYRLSENERARLVMMAEQNREVTYPGFVPDKSNGSLVQTAFASYTTE